MEEITGMLPLSGEELVKALHHGALPIVVTVYGFQRDREAAYSVQIDNQLSCLHEQITGTDQFHALRFLHQARMLECLYLGVVQQRYDTEGEEDGVSLGT